MDSSSIQRGTRIGRFVVVSELGRGGMGAVYAAHDPQLDRQVALKVMRQATGDEEDRLRMLREGQAMARVTHANVITVYEVGTEGGNVFLAQELLDGGTLRDWLEKGPPRPQREILEKFLAAGRGLEAAHAVGLVHRDFKPENVLLGKDGRVRVADFGLARAMPSLTDALAVTAKGGGPHREAVHGDVTSSPMNQLTRTGAVMGTPMFMAPEQHLGERADARSDQFAFCVSLYHALYKAWPFEGKSAPALADAVIEGRLAPAPKDAKVSARLRSTLLRGLSREPAARYPAMEGLLADLEREVVVPGQRSRAPWIVGGALVALAAAGAGAYALLRERETAEPAVVTLRDAAPLPSTVDTDALTTAKGIAWLTAAVDRGQLDDAIDKYDLASAVALKDGDSVRAALSEAAGVYLRVQRGELAAADKALVTATQHAGTDATAMAYVDLAEAALASARGQFPAARERSARCASQLSTTAPVLASICHEIHGDTLAALGDAVAARVAYDAGLALATQHKAIEQASTLQLALAQLELDALSYDNAKTIAQRVQAECAERGAVGCDVRARIQLARILLSAGSAQDALERLTTVKPAAIESFPVRIAHAIALGEVHGTMNETGEDEVTGLDRIEQARAQAEVKGMKPLMLEAKLARLRVLLTHDDAGADPEHVALVKQAKDWQHERIAKLADVARTELSGPPRATLPADGGVPAVRTGSSGEPVGP